LGALAISCVTTGGLTYLFAGMSASHAAGVGTAAPAAATPNPGATPAATAGSGTFAGDVVQTRFGPVQVQVEIADGSIANATALQAPGGDFRSARISSIAVPMLNSEALTAQSSHVDTVSGATYTSRGYAQSLQAALDQARAAGATSIS
jgi:uncharacterized protein with FMN-binding domain